MTAPPWGHKPHAVDPWTFWDGPPPSPSPRLAYWLRRLDEDSWHPNKYFCRESYDTRARWLGVYLWEYLHVISPVLDADAWSRPGVDLSLYNPQYVTHRVRELDALLIEHHMDRLRTRFLAAINSYNTVRSAL